jgi:hypothetical protein
MWNGNSSFSNSAAPRGLSEHLSEVLERTQDLWHERPADLQSRLEDLRKMLHSDSARVEDLRSMVEMEASATVCFITEAIDDAFEQACDHYQEALAGLLVLVDDGLANSTDWVRSALAEADAAMERADALNRALREELLAA